MNKSWNIIALLAVCIVLLAGCVVPAEMETKIQLTDQTLQWQQPGTEYMLVELSTDQKTVIGSSAVVLSADLQGKLGGDGQWTGRLLPESVKIPVSDRTDIYGISKPYGIELHVNFTEKQTDPSIPDAILPDLNIGTWVTAYLVITQDGYTPLLFIQVDSQENGPSKYYFALEAETEEQALQRLNELRKSVFGDKVIPLTK